MLCRLGMGKTMEEEIINMKIAIHDTSAGWSFCQYWKSYCEEQNIEYKLVNAYDSDIVQQLEDCDVFMWHHNHLIHKDRLFAKSLLFSLETAGKKVFPDFHTGWHFDDKLGQKYLFESIGAPFVKSYVFYDFAQSEKWIKQTSFPKIFKLRGGAGSSNVQLVKNRRVALKLSKKAIQRGIASYNKLGDLKETIRKYKLKKTSVVNVLKSFARLFFSTEFAKKQGNETGYAYFQDFIPGNLFDIRVVVIGNKAFAIRRNVRKNDFRASGSGKILYSKDLLDERCVKISFDVTQKIKSQCAAYDYVFDKQNTPLIVEVSFGFDQKGYNDCVGYWDEEMNWYEGKFNPQAWIVELLING